MSRKNKFGITNVEDIPVGLVPRRRGTGPMSSAVRETAESVAEATEARVEQRQKNAADAREYRTAIEEGRVLARIPLDDVSTEDLPRDRLDLDGVAAADEMDELKASIRAYGQKEPIEVYRDSEGTLQLKKGWRRLTALRALHGETGDAAFATVLARVDTAEVTDRLPLYIDMVEENLLRENLTFAEMAQVAIEAAADPALEANSAADVVGRLYGSLHKMKRSYVRAFVYLLEVLGDDLQYPKALARDTGVALSRRLQEAPKLVGPLKRELAVCLDADAQAAVIAALLADHPAPGAAGKPRAETKARQKFEFHVGTSKITARRGELRVKDGTDFTEVPRERLEAAIAAFQRALRDGD